MQVFQSIKSDLKSIINENDTVIQGNLASYLAYGIKGIVRVLQGDGNIRNKSTHRRAKWARQ